MDIENMEIKESQLHFIKMVDICEYHGGRFRNVGDFSADFVFEKIILKIWNFTKLSINKNTIIHIFIDFENTRGLASSFIDQLAFRFVNYGFLNISAVDSSFSHNDSENPKENYDTDVDGYGAEFISYMKEYISIKESGELDKITKEFETRSKENYSDFKNKTKFFNKVLEHLHK